ncbi:two component response regulator [Gluconobacter oxydans NBRC 3293]|uniref:Two component response regulator n=3 Tax=Gluconobacter TaxID=441 RepID=A0A829WWL6_GLUOY|nr:two component response regulator [Gluconobacter oxydans NBRC 3293]
MIAMYVMSMKETSSRAAPKGGFRGDSKRVNRKHVLVVEDQALLRFLAADMLEEAGYEASLAADADEALQVLARNPDIGTIFSDVNMPGDMDGVALARLIRERRPEIGLVLTSGTRIQDLGQLPGGTMFLSKPYEWDEVYRCLEQVRH